MASASENVELDVDNVIEKLLEVRGQRPGKQVQLSENEIRALCIKSREIFLQQPILLELQVCRCCVMSREIALRASMQYASSYFQTAVCSMYDSRASLQTCC